VNPIGEEVQCDDKCLSARSPIEPVEATSLLDLACSVKGQEPNRILWSA